MAYSRKLNPHALAMAFQRVSGKLGAHSGSISCPVCIDLGVSDGLPCSSPKRLNAILFMGDHVSEMDCLLNATVDCLSKLENVRKVVTRKLGTGADVWIVDAPRFAWDDKMACYDGFLEWLSPWGHPINGYDPRRLSAANTTLGILKDSVFKMLKEIGAPTIGLFEKEASVSPEADYRTIVMGFSKGGIVLNQLMSELAYIHRPDYKPESGNSNSVSKRHDFVSIPRTPEEFLNSIEEFHYIDVGMNECGAYITDQNVLEGIAKVAKLRNSGLTVFMHGTPRQWGDPGRAWICAEKDQCVGRLREAGQKYSEGKLKVNEKTYFEGESRSLEMHFAVLEAFELSFPELTGS